MVFPHRRALRARLLPFRYIDEIDFKVLAHNACRWCGGIRDGRSKSGLQRDAG